MTRSEPTDRDGRRRLHPFTLLFATISVARRLILPAVVGGISRADGDAGRLVGWVVGILAIPAFVIAALRYATFRYRLGPDELVIDSGVLRRQHRVIPLVRVQNIDLRESALQRVCGVVELRVETAGSGSGAEASLEVLGRSEAEQLRTELLARRRMSREQAGRHQGEGEGEGEGELDAASASEAGEESPPVHVLAHLGTARLAAAGATANEAGFIAAVLAAGLQFVDDFALERYLPVLAIQERLESATVTGAVLVIALALLTLLMLGWVVSIVGAVVGYHDFTLERIGGELRKRHGLLGRRQTTIPLERVQGLRIEESLLRRPLHLAALKIETAGGSPREQQKRGAETFVPIASSADVPALVRGVFADLDVGSARFLRVHPRSRQRAFMRHAFVALVVLGFSAVVSLVQTGVVSSTFAWWVPLLGAAWGLAAWQYRHRGYALLPGYVLARAGVLNRITWIVPDRKIQTVHRVATPFQRRHGLSTLVIDTASGGRQGRVADLGDDAAEAMLEEGATRARSRRRPADVVIDGTGAPATQRSDDRNAAPR